MSLLDQTAQEQVEAAASTFAKVTPAALGGQLLFGYTINEVAAIIGIVVTLTQFSYWIYEKFIKDKED